MYRTAKAQKNGFEAAIIAVKKYMEHNTKYPTAMQLLKWCTYQNPPIEGVQHRFASIILPILKYPEYKFNDYSRDHVCQFLYDYAVKHSDVNNGIDAKAKHNILKIQKCIMDFKIDGKTFSKMKKNQWIQKLNDYVVSQDIAKTYYNILKNQEREQNKKYGKIEQNDEKKEHSNTTEATPQPSIQININHKAMQETLTTNDNIVMNGDKNENESISINSAVEHEINSLKQENKELNKKIKKLTCPTKEICKLNLQELNELEAKLQNDLNIIHEVKEKLYKNNFYCILCLKNQKNLVINQCNHFVLCSECEKKMEPKKCPICRMAFTHTTTLKL